MSVRSGSDDTASSRYAGIASLNTAATADQLRDDIDLMRAMQAADGTAVNTASLVDEALHFDQLTETEKSAATIGAAPEEWRPIGWMNTSHYSTLLKKNAIGGRLTQQIEAFKVVAGVSVAGAQLRA